MRHVTSEDRGADKHRRRLVTAIKECLRDLNIQLSLLNRQIGAHIELRDVDFDCLEVLSRHGPLSPSALAKRSGLHPATMTGVLDRLERAGWVVRERDHTASDRRAVAVRALRDRNAELFRLLAGMSSTMEQICASYTNTELELIADFLRRTTNAGAEAAEDLAR